MWEICNFSKLKIESNIVIKMYQWILWRHQWFYFHYQGQIIERKRIQSGVTMQLSFVIRCLRKRKWEKIFSIIYLNRILSITVNLIYMYQIVIFSSSSFSREYDWFIYRNMMVINWHLFVYLLLSKNIPFVM
jgi:hypothetical protein